MANSSSWVMTLWFVCSLWLSNFLNHWFLEALRMHPWEDFLFPFPAPASWIPWGPEPHLHQAGAYCTPPAAFHHCQVERPEHPYLTQHRFSSSCTVRCFTFGYCKWNPHLLNSEITADLSRGESPAWKMRNSLGAETLEKDTRSGYFPWPYESSFLRNIAWVKVLHLHFTSSSKNGEPSTPYCCATAQGSCRELGTQISAFTGCLVVSAVLDTGHLHLPSYCLLQCWNA